MDTSASKRSIQRFVITKKAPTRAFSWLKAATTALTFKTLLYHSISYHNNTVGAVRNETLVFVNFSAKDASKLKISVPIIKRRS